MTHVEAQMKGSRKSQSVRHTTSHRVRHQFPPSSRQFATLVGQSAQVPGTFAQTHHGLIIAGHNVGQRVPDSVAPLC